MPFSVYLPESLRAAFKPELGHEFGKGHREHQREIDGTPTLGKGQHILISPAFHRYLRFSGAVA